MISEYLIVIFLWHQKEIWSKYINYGLTPFQMYSVKDTCPYYP